MQALGFLDLAKECGVIDPVMEVEFDGSKRGGTVVDASGASGGTNAAEADIGCEAVVEN